MFAGFAGGDDLPGVVVRIAANRHDVDIGIGQHVTEIIIDRNGAAIFVAEFGGIEFARGINCGDLPQGSGVEGWNVRRSDPAVSDNADVIFLHKRATAFVFRAMKVQSHIVRAWLSKEKRRWVEIMEITPGSSKERGCPRLTPSSACLFPNHLEHADEGVRAPFCALLESALLRRLLHV